MHARFPVFCNPEWAFLILQLLLVSLATYKLVGDDDHHGGLTVIVSAVLCFGSSNDLLLWRFAA